MNTKAFIGLLLLLPALTFNLMGEDRCLQIEGTITMRALAMKDHPEKIFGKYTFTVTTDGKLWNMLLKRAPDFAGPADPRFLFELSYDGQSTRERIRFAVPNNPPSEQLQSRQGQVPDSIVGLPTGPIWTTYASGDFFENQKSNRATNYLSMTPPSFRSLEPEKCTFTLPDGTDWKTPDHLTFLNEGHHWVKGPDGTLTKKEFPPPFNQGYVAIRLQVLTRINLDASTSIPGSVEISYYYPSKEPVEIVTTEKLSVYEIQTTSVKKIERPASFHR